MTEWMSVPLDYPARGRTINWLRYRTNFQHLNSRMCWTSSEQETYKGQTPFHGHSHSTIESVIFLSVPLCSAHKREREMLVCCWMESASLWFEEQLPEAARTTRGTCALGGIVIGRRCRRKSPAVVNERRDGVARPFALFVRRSLRWVQDPGTSTR